MTTHHVTPGDALLVRRVGFTGTRHGMTDLQACMFEGLVPACEEFHHGSCQGADVEAARIVRRTFARPVHIVCHPGPDGDPCREASGVDDEARSGKTHFARNRDIVNETDLLIAAPRDMERKPRGGTCYTIGYVEKIGKPVWIVWPDGSIEKLKGLP